LIQQNWEMIQKIDAAFRAGDLEALRAAVEDPEIIPNGAMPLAIGPCLEYAIYHSPIEFVRTLLEMGCEVGQGAGIASPMPAADLPRWIKEWKGLFAIAPAAAPAPGALRNR